MMERICEEFYRRDSVEVAQDLLGKVLVIHNKNVLPENENSIISGIIVETEAYMGTIDKAAHAYNGRRTKRLEVMYGPPGRAYVYFIYGLYYSMNVITREEGIPQGVLIRALEPLKGISQMSLNRYNTIYETLTKKQIINLTNGPSKLCSALKIDKSLNGVNLITDDSFFIEEGLKEKFNIISSKRIGIDYAEEAKDYLWRFYIEGNEYVSKA